MYRIISLFLAIAFASFSFAQGNGQLDEFSDFSTSYTYDFTTSDGVKLRTDLYLPITSDSLMVDLPFGNLTFPVQVIPKGVQLIIYDSVNNDINPNPYQLPMVFTRTPYSKSEDDALAIVMNMLGYAYTLQDMRGRYQSEGVYFPMYSDAWKKDAYHPNQSHVIDFTEISDPHNSIYHQDGRESIMFLQDSLLWDYDLNGDGITDITDKAYNGYMAMFGASAMGNSQYQAAAAYQKPEEGNDLKALVPIVSTLEYFNGVVQHNGVFRQALIVNWLQGQMEDVAVVNPADDDMQNDVHSTFDFGNLSPDEIIDLCIDQFSTIPDENGYTAMYPNYTQRCDLDGSYAPINEIGESDLNGNINRYKNMEVPAYHLSGWWDIFVDGQIDTYQQIMAETSEETQELQKLVIGPWTHGTIGMDSVGDLRYPESVFDINILYGDISDNTDNIRVDKIVESEVLSWLRHLMNYQEDNYLGEPKIVIPESEDWQTFGPYLIRVPAADYKIRFPSFVNFVTGHEGLAAMPVQLQTPDTTITFAIDIPADSSIQTPSSNPVGDPATPVVDFPSVKNVRFYVPGPINDGINANENIGNYWYESDTFPLEYGVEEISYYFHDTEQSIDTAYPLDAAGPKNYIHNPDNPVHTIGGGNLTLRTPVVNKTNAGPINLAWPDYAPLTLNRPDVIQFSTAPIVDSLCIIGYPKMKLWASTMVEGGGLTDTDFFIRIVDVYPDGREFYVSEGAVNGRAREYARSLAEGNPNDQALYSNLESGQLYELDFKMMPIAYTFGHDHQMKILISSSNYPRYQSNPNLPIEEGEFFRRDVLEEKTYEFNGVEMSARSAEQSIFCGPYTPTQIILPVYTAYGVGMEESFVKDSQIQIWPNPTQNLISVSNQKHSTFDINIRNINGQLLRSFSSSQQLFPVDMQSLSPGIYLFEIVNGDGSKEVRKVVFQP
ncbi:CocE/NonD family hydrolase [Lentimicrobium sp. S6]|uniref:CocE/NonD family hydrolase n=1 Tax=Lentimicrobium sp. S6 TaxID=2735872 RepID=UPI0015579B36|nr:CocE/NonD family hydrolase [Lentimicrobium sp. S6]NPD45635.1 CocE/NonD family hydrolase [Lentimicrobium sp. S6]